MKRRDFGRLAAFAAALVASSALLPSHSLAQDKKWKIGFSQATTIEPWRAQFNKDIIAEAAKHPNVELIIIGTVLVQERNAADLFATLRLPLRRPARTQTAAEERTSEETPSLKLGGTAK